MQHGNFVVNWNIMIDVCHTCMDINYWRAFRWDIVLSDVYNVRSPIQILIFKNCFSVADQARWHAN